MPEIVSFPDPEQLAESLAEAIAGLLRQAIAARSQASMVVSGGTTPGPLFLRLRCKTLAWERVTITLADERWVDPDHDASNERLIRSLLLQDLAGHAHFIPLKNKAVTAREGELECNRSLADIPRPFDLVLLGMGNDGHTASLFPGARNLQQALNLESGQDCLAVTPPQAPYERMTLTLPALLDTRQIFLHLTGQRKKQILRQAMTDGPVNLMPVRSILRQQHPPVQIYWSP